MREYLSISIEGASYGEYSYYSGKQCKYIKDKELVYVTYFPRWDGDVHVGIFDKYAREWTFVKAGVLSVTDLGSNLVVVSEDIEYFN